MLTIDPKAWAWFMSGDTGGDMNDVGGALKTEAYKIFSEEVRRG